SGGIVGCLRTGRRRLYRGSAAGARRTTPSGGRLPFDIQTLQAARGGLEAWRVQYVAASAHEAWQTHGAWITSTQPTFGPAIAERWRHAAGNSDEVAQQAWRVRNSARQCMRDMLGEDGIAILPSASSLALPRDADARLIEN